MFTLPEYIFSNQIMVADVSRMSTSVAECDGGVCCVERLFSSSLVAIVGASFPCKLRICHFKKGTEICSYNYSTPILALRLNRLVCNVLLLFDDLLFLRSLNHIIIFILPYYRGILPCGYVLDLSLVTRSENA